MVLERPLFIKATVVHALLWSFDGLFELNLFNPSDELVLFFSVNGLLELLPFLNMFEALLLFFSVNARLELLLFLLICLKYEV